MLSGALLTLSCSKPENSHKEPCAELARVHDSQIPTLQKPTLLPSDRRLHTDTTVLMNAPMASDASWWLVWDLKASSNFVSFLAQHDKTLSMLTMAMMFSGIAPGTVLHAIVASGPATLNGSCTVLLGDIPTGFTDILKKAYARYGSALPYVSLTDISGGLKVSTPWGNATIKQHKGMLTVETLDTRCSVGIQPAEEYRYIVTGLPAGTAIRFAMKGAPPVPEGYSKVLSSVTAMESLTGYISPGMELKKEAKTRQWAAQIQIRARFRTRSDTLASREALRMGLGMLSTDIVPSLKSSFRLQHGDPHGTVVSRGRFLRLSMMLSEKQILDLMGTIGRVLTSPNLP